MIVSLCGQKGGAGKTTAAVSIAVELVARGRRVLLVDLDPQGSLRTWGDVAAEARVEHAPTVTALGAGVHRHLPPLAAAHDVTVIDCPPAQGELQRAAMILSDVALLPCGPAALDVWALAASADLVREAQAAKPSLRAAVLITRKIPGTVLAKQALGAIEKLGLPVLDASLCQRVTYQEAPAAGLGPTTYAPRSPAAAEVRRLVSELERLGGLARPRKGAR
ncbi:MAG: ParA family partition ATPase [Polyangiales bacterium]